MRTSSSFFRTIIIGLAAGTSLLAGCTSWFQPRPHELMVSTRRIVEESCNAASLPRELSKVVLTEHRVEPGDVLLVEPAEFDASIRLAGDQTVQPDGAIELGQFGRLDVVDKTIDEIRNDVERVVQEETEKDVAVNVRIVEINGKVVYVLGEVNSPGAYPLKGNETVLDAIIAAGGVTDQADQTGVLLNKPTAPVGCRMVLPVCYKHIVQLGDTSTNYQLEPGDRVFVPSQSFWRSILSFLCLPEREDCPRCASPPFGCPTDFSTMDHVVAPHHFEEPLQTTPEIQMEEIPVPAASSRASRRTRRVRRVTGSSQP